jgi:hypothetical protein
MSDADTFSGPGLQVLAAGVERKGMAVRLRVRMNCDKQFDLFFAPHVAAAIGAEMQAVAAAPIRRPRLSARLCAAALKNQPLMKPSGMIL